VDFAGEKPSDVFRIVILGDSFTFGEGTPEHLTYPALLGRELASVRVDGRRIEVINLGIPAEDTSSELGTYFRFARHLNPDWVILQWNTNDFPSSEVQEDHLRLIGARYRELFSGTEGSWSHLLRFVRTRARMWQISRDLIATTIRDVEAETSSFEHIARMRQAVEEDRAGFTVAAFPELIRFDGYPYAAILHLLREFCRSRQIPFVDILPGLSVHRDRDLWVHETDHHPNPIAHAIAAQALLEGLGLPVD
jgi:lysophospholipase L1-like esterase